MLSIGKLVGGNEDYYLHTVASGVDRVRVLVVIASLPVISTVTSMCLLTILGALCSRCQEILKCHSVYDI